MDSAKGNCTEGRNARINGWGVGHVVMHIGPVLSGTQSDEANDMKIICFRCAHKQLSKLFTSLQINKKRTGHKISILPFLYSPINSCWLNWNLSTFWGALARLTCSGFFLSLWSISLCSISSLSPLPLVLFPFFVFSFIFSAVILRTLNPLPPQLSYLLSLPFTLGFLICVSGTGHSCTSTVSFYSSSHWLWDLWALWLDIYQRDVAGMNRGTW